jgi:hypothetical protein
MSAPAFSCLLDAAGRRDGCQALRRARTSAAEKLQRRVIYLFFDLIFGVSPNGGS